MRIPLLPAIALLTACACSSNSGGPQIGVDLQAALAQTSDVAYIDITVRPLNDQSVISYYSGVVPANVDGPYPGRKWLEEMTKLYASTDYTFDASAYDTNKVLLKRGLTVQKATPAAGSSLSVTIVIDLNDGANNETSETDILAITDNIPVFSVPLVDQLPAVGGALTLTYAAVDADWPVDPDETTTYFTTILAGNVTSAATSLFTLGQAFTITRFKDATPVFVLCGAVDRFYRTGWAIMELDPGTGAFRLVEKGDGFGVLPGTAPPQPRAINNHDDPDGAPPGFGPLEMVALRRMGVIQVISDTAGHSAATPDDLAYWLEGTIVSFNRYDYSAGITPDHVYQLRITETAYSTDFVDTMKVIPGSPTFTWGAQAQEAGFALTDPSIDDLTAASYAPGSGVDFTGNELSGLSMAYFTDASGNFVAYADNASASDANDAHIDIPAGLANATYNLVVFTYGRLHTQTPITISCHTTVTVGTVGSGDPDDNATVAMHTADGTLLDVQTTDADGQAHFSVPAGGASITVGQDLDTNPTMTTLIGVSNCKSYLVNTPPNTPIAANLGTVTATLPGAFPPADIYTANFDNLFFGDTNVEDPTVAFMDTIGNVYGGAGGGLVMDGLAIAASAIDNGDSSDVDRADALAFANGIPVSVDPNTGEYAATINPGDWTWRSDLPRLTISFDDFQSLEGDTSFENEHSFPLVTLHRPQGDELVERLPISGATANGLNVRQEYFMPAADWGFDSVYAAAEVGGSFPDTQTSDESIVVQRFLTTSSPVSFDPSDVGLPILDDPSIADLGTAQPSLFAQARHPNPGAPTDVQAVAVLFQWGDAASGAALSWTIFSPATTVAPFAFTAPPLPPGLFPVPSVENPVTAAAALPLSSTQFANYSAYLESNPGSFFGGLNNLVYPSLNPLTPFVTRITLFSVANSLLIRPIHHSVQDTILGRVATMLHAN